ncbi:hypothetical protein J8273_2572 [Carpediemonas membranifera]|uniref:Uncharacterized protein n=1 Tax=Carpediemonas membranifera TaxID=201153 RepID=A0A8J6EB45_9EUKA|nr:hypothetical protein J8273_2572 [Carpediemonas membranifera]|eukprot:KAG9396220.1 hypothetical protein J8273_2572 [Carpediemonas membranifera]
MKERNKEATPQSAMLRHFRRAVGSPTPPGVHESKGALPRKADAPSAANTPVAVMRKEIGVNKADSPPAKPVPKAARRAKSEVVEAANEIMNDLMPTSPFSTKPMNVKRGTLSKERRPKRKSARLANKGLAAVLADSESEASSDWGEVTPMPVGRRPAPKLHSTTEEVMAMQAHGMQSLAKPGASGMSEAANQLLESEGPKGRARRKPRNIGRRL